MDVSDFSDPSNAPDVEAILARMSGKAAEGKAASAAPAGDAPAEDTEGDLDGLDLASEELIAAAAAGDAKGVSAALRNAFAMLREAPEE